MVGVWENYTPSTRIVAEGSIEKSFYVIASGDVSVTVGDKVVAIDHPESASGPWAAVARTSPITVLAKAATSRVMAS